MSIEVKVPELPESIADAVVVAWYKKQGEAIKQDDNLVDLETDKVVLEVPAIVSGVVEKIFFEEGSVVTAGQVLAVIDETAEVSEKITSESMASKVTEPSAVSVTKVSADIDNDIAISPSARKMIDENNLDASIIQGSGRHGRILKEDILDFMNSKAAPVEKTTTEIKSVQKPVASVVAASGQRIEKRVPMTRLRTRIAERLLQAQQNAAILTTFNEVNMKPVMELRAKYKEKFEKEYGTKLGFMSFFVKAALEALKQFPAVNASIDGNDIVYHG